MKEKYLKPSNIKNFKIDHFISTDTASFFIGDKDSIDKERNKDKGKKKRHRSTIERNYLRDLKC